MKYMYLKAIGTIDMSVLENLMKILNLSFPFKFIKDNNYPLFAFEPKRNQYYAKKIIEKLAHELPADCEKLIGITDVDLCTPVLTFVYGEAQLGGTVAVVSLKRLKQEFYHLPPDNTLLASRLAKECMHELGHCYGLYHCDNSRCAMFFSSSILNIDNKLENYCIRCREFLGRIIRKENYAQK